MALFDFHENFEAGGKGGFDTEVDTGNRLDFPGPQQLRHDMLPVFPHRGGYCMRVNLGKNILDAYVSKTVTWAASSTNYGRFEFLVGTDVQAGNDGDVLDLVILQSASGNEAAISLARIEPAGLVLGLRDGTNPINHYVKIDSDDWICVEWSARVDQGVNNDGFLTVFLGNDRIHLAGLDQAAMTGVRYGAMNHGPATGGDWSGNIYFDDIHHHSARLYPDYGPSNLRLDGETMAFFKSGFGFVGRGHIMGCQLIGGTGVASLAVYDSDDVNYSENMLKEYLSTSTDGQVMYSQSVDGPYLFKVDYGLYVKLTGTDARALIRMGMVDELALADIQAEMEGEAEEEEPEGGGGES